MSEVKFNFMAQNGFIEDLLGVCVDVLPFLPKDKQELLTEALKEFEESGAPMLWSCCDVDAEDELGLTDGEKREAISRFISRQGCDDSDWDEIHSYARDVLSERVTSIKVNYDPLHTGGVFLGEGAAVFIPLTLIAALESENPGVDGVEMAFTKTTKMDCMHIIKYDLNQYYNKDGEPI